jgi:glycosyltransferase involved in cell wall biosynthesis
MKILFIHNDYARYSGEEHACEAIAKLLASRGHSILWYRRSSTEISGSRSGQLMAAFSAMHNPAANRAVAELVERESPDVAFVQNLYPLISPSVLSLLRRLSVPVVMRCPNYRLFCPSGLLFSHGEVCERCRGRAGEWWCVRRNCEHALPKSMAYALRNAAARLTDRYHKTVSQFVVLSEFQRDYFSQAGIPADRIRVVPNMVETAALSTASCGQGETIAFMGRIAPEKGFEDFVAAARQLPQLQFAAAGAVKRGYEHALHDMPANLEWRGFLEGDALRAFRDDARVFVTCSRWFEGFPNTIAGNMAAGKPVVASALGAIPEIVEDGVTGLLYPPGDVGALVGCIARLSQDAALRQQMGEAGRDRVASRYGEEPVYAALNAALHTAVDSVSER